MKDIVKEPRRLDLESADNAKINLEALYQIAPSCFTEARNPKTGELRHVVNFDTLRTLLGDDTVEKGDESYEFTWVGKQEARAEVLRTTDNTLRPVVEDSVDWDNTQNLYIEGDNLEVLKLLQKSYLGKVKMIYIDPPYNTGNDFVYHDNFAEDKEQYELELGAKDDLGNRYFKNTDSNGKYHSDWCSMMYARLMVAKTLLSDDGIIFISIDDNEVANLKKISDDVFGEQNFVSKFDWRKKTGANDAKDIAVITESILLYSKNHDVSIQNNIWKRDEDSINNDRYKYEDDFVETRGKYYYDTLDRGGLQYSDSMNFGISAPDGGVIFPNGRDHFVNDGWIWKWSKDKVTWGLENKFLEFVKSPKSKGSSYTIKYKVYQYVDNEGNIREKSGRAFMNLITEPINQMGNAEMKDIFEGKTPFSNPKPIGLVKYLLGTIKSENSLILDFFSGSATTAHTVMRLNAEDNGNRKFIMVQLPEETPSDSEARKAGYNNICEIGKERIRRAGKKIKEEHPEATNLDTGFRVFRLDDNIYEDVAKRPIETTQEALDQSLSNIMMGTSDMDLLFTCMLNWGVELSLPMKTEKVDGKNIYTVNDGDMVACFDENVTDNVVKEMAKKMPVRVIFRDSCFKDDSAKINIYETFKQLRGWSDEEAYNNIRVI